MIPRECKRLAEVDFPIAVVSRHAVGESRQGHPSTLHLWWARRPLAACRSMLLALLLPDPCDVNCPVEFKLAARSLLPPVQGCPGPKDDDLQRSLLKFIGDFANWDLSKNSEYLVAARGLVAAAYPDETPLVVDPFAGGGSIPLEALRLGCHGFSSDLNPVAGLIQKVMLADIPRYGAGLADQLRKAGAEVAEQVEREVSEHYPMDPNGLRPIAYLWARTVRCESPDCGAEIPLVRSFWLCKKPHRKSALRPSIIRTSQGAPSVIFEVFTPSNESEVLGPTVTRARAKCLCCGLVLSPARVRAQLSAQRGGANVIFDDKGERFGGAILLAVVVRKSDDPSRGYRSPTKLDYDVVYQTERACERYIRERESTEISPFPDEIIPMTEIRRISVPLYGATTWGDLYTNRQKLVISLYINAARRSKNDVILSLFAFVVDRLVMQLSAHCRWKATGESLIDMFGRHAIGMVWDFAEGSPISGENGLFLTWIEAIASYVDGTSALKLTPSDQALADACNHPLPDGTASVWFTDPPYYDSIPYAHLADCFYVWLKRLLKDTTRGTDFLAVLSPKDGECVVDRPHSLSDSTKDTAYFEDCIAKAAREGKRILSTEGIGAIVFAHKTTEGWEALLGGVISAGWAITGSWPIATELASRLNARDTASLNASVHLICRPRSSSETGDWATVLRELPVRVADWMERLQGEGVRGSDLVFACIGPALEVFSRYNQVETAEGKAVPLSDFLEKVWEVVGRSALEQVLGTAESLARNGATGALEEDARLTALFLWTLQSTDTGNGNGKAKLPALTEDEFGDAEEDDSTQKYRKTKGFSLVYDVVRRFAQPLGIHLEDWEGRIIETEKGTVKLLAVSERAKQLFGEEGAQAVAADLERSAEGFAQLTLFPDDASNAPRVRGRGRITGRRDGASIPSVGEHRGATTLDRVHAAMLLQKLGRSNALRSLLAAEKERGQEFVRLANSLSALYPRESEEKRLVDAMLLAVPK